MKTEVITTQSVRKWGNSSGVRLPKKILKAAKLEDDQQVTVSLKGQSIILTPVKSNDEYTLKKMLEGATPNNAHGEFDWGPDVGAEIIND
ncbi:MAG TPA: AbrB/MazE/SpoVT family DNA-binding domain-containing protein [Candidatus Sulfotelmatobacter sp.]|nr:AbrB/MazE/SpoVT family DNA-binding domain-containing protein [Candidatus Sulfotelmatobacter sp.]